MHLHDGEFFPVYPLTPVSSRETCDQNWQRHQNRHHPGSLTPPGDAACRASIASTESARPSMPSSISSRPTTWPSH